MRNGTMKNKRDINKLMEDLKQHYDMGTAVDEAAIKKFLSEEGNSDLDEVLLAAPTEIRKVFN